MQEQKFAIIWCYEAMNLKSRILGRLFTVSVDTL